MGTSTMCLGSLQAIAADLKLSHVQGSKITRRVSSFVDKSGVEKLKNVRLSQNRTGKKQQRYSKCSRVRAQVLEEIADASTMKAAADEEHLHLGDALALDGQGTRRLKVLVAGAGIGGLVFALAAKNRGLDVKVFERDLTAIRGEGQYRGPIQIQSNALAALEAVDPAVAEEIMANGCVTGDRINGLVDGVTGEWYIKFDTFTPAVEKGLPVTRVISRMTLQEILARAVGTDIIKNGVTVVDFEDDGHQVKAIMSDGSHYVGDLLVGADGIRSKVREKLLGPKDATYSDYTCYTGIADFTPADIENVGYRVFLGHKKYFVSSDVGHGKMQWYAFYNEPAGGSDPPGGRKERLFELFGTWCDNVVDLIMATEEDMILRRDIYDRIPIMQWSKGRTTLLGDSAHAMQPNMGQGGCMAIEDGFQLALDLEKAVRDRNPQEVDVSSVLKQYESERRMRVGAIHGMARMAAVMASTYRAYLGEGIGPLKWLAKLRIPHWGRVSGQFVVKYTMPLMLQWVLGGNTAALEGRAPYCSLEEKANSNLKKWMEDDDALERATDALWYLLPAGERMPEGDVTASGRELLTICCQDGACTIVGSQACSEAEGTAAVVSAEGVDRQHASIECRDGIFHLTDLNSSSGTWIVRIDGARKKASPGQKVRVHPGDTLEFGPNKEAHYRIKLRKSASYKREREVEPAMAA